MRQDRHIKWNRLYVVAATVGLEFVDDEMEHLRRCPHCLYEFEQLVLEVLRDKEILANRGRMIA